MSRKTPSPHGVLRRSIDGCKKQHLPTSNTFWKKSTHKPWIPTRKPLRKTRLNYSLSTTLIHDFAGMITLGPVFWTSLHGCKRKHPRNCKWTKVSKSSSHFFAEVQLLLLQAPILDTSHLGILTAWTWCSSTWSWYFNNHNENMFFCHISTPLNDFVQLRF